MAAWAGALLHALAREEKAGRRPAVLTEAGLATWKRFRGRLDYADLVALLFEDAAVLHPVPFDGPRLDPALRSLTDTTANAWVNTIASLDLELAAAAYIEAQARLLDLPTRLARSDLHVVKPHQRVLELPGTGGQLSHHLATAQPGLSLAANFTIACGTWQELTLAGIVSMDLGSHAPEVIVHTSAGDLRRGDHPLRQRSFDFVVGLSPDKGGALRVHDELALWYPAARVLLV